MPPDNADRFQHWAVEFELDEQTEQDIDRLMAACAEYEALADQKVEEN